MFEWQGGKRGHRGTSASAAALPRVSELEMSGYLTNCRGRRSSDCLCRCSPGGTAATLTARYGSAK